MKKHLREEDYVPYLDGRLDAAERTRADGHVAACTDCRTRLNEIRWLMGVLDGWKAAETSPAFDTALRARLEEEKAGRVNWFVFRPAYAVGLAAAVLLALALTFWPSGYPETQAPEVVQTSPPATEEVAQATPDIQIPELVPTEETEGMAALEVLENYELLEQFDVLFEPLNGEEKL